MSMMLKHMLNFGGQKMNNGYHKLFSGFLMILIDINIGSFDIIPDIIGYLLVFYGLGMLNQETDIPSFRVARVFSFWMALLAGYAIIMDTLGLIQSFAFQSYLAMILTTLGELLLVVYMYHGMETHMILQNDELLASRFGRESRLYAIIQGISLIAMSFSINLTQEKYGFFIIILVVIGIIMYIRILINLHTIKKYFENKPLDIME